MSKNGSRSQPDQSPINVKVKRQFNFNFNGVNVSRASNDLAHLNIKQMYSHNQSKNGGGSMLKSILDRTPKGPPR